MNSLRASLSQDVVPETQEYQKGYDSQSTVAGDLGDGGTGDAFDGGFVRAIESKRDLSRQDSSQGTQLGAYDLDDTQDLDTSMSLLQLQPVQQRMRTTSPPFSPASNHGTSPRSPSPPPRTQPKGASPPPRTPPRSPSPPPRTPRKSPSSPPLSYTGSDESRATSPTPSDHPYDSVTHSDTGEDQVKVTTVADEDEDPKEPIDRNFDVVDKIVELVERMDVAEVIFFFRLFYIFYICIKVSVVIVTRIWLI